MKRADDWCDRCKMPALTREILTYGCCETCWAERQQKSDDTAQAFGIGIFRELRGAAVTNGQDDERRGRIVRKHVVDG